MNTFRQHLVEVYGEKEIKDLVFMNLDQSDLALPISKRMFDRLLGERKKLRAVHLTDVKGFQNLIKLQGTKKQIAAMTTLTDMDVVRDGVAQKAGMAVVITGFPVIESEFDLHSQVDKQGRRWITLERITLNIGFAELWRGMKKQIKDVRDEILYDLEKKFGGSPDFWEYLHIPLESEEWEEFQDELKRADKKLKRTVTMRKLQGHAIKLYMDKIEKQVWKPNLNAIISILQPTGEVQKRSRWNEISLVDIEIKEVHMIRVDVLKYAKETWDIDVNDPDEFEAIQDFDDDLNGEYNLYKKLGYDKKFKSVFVDTPEAVGLDRNSEYHFQQLFLDVNMFNYDR
jgi:hypothetical protein|tara:strand:- start:369 stop:1394 length:1026 start_codon:yes stop_codon:yes gene_type:complete